MPYYLKREGQVVGPYARAELKDMLKHGEIRGTIAAREDGDREWSTVEKCLRGENRRIVTARDFPASRRGPASARSGGSSLGLTAYRKFAAATHHAARSVAGIGSRRPSASVSRPPGDRPPPARPPVDYRGDLLHGAFWTTGGILALILSFVFTSGTLAGGLYGIFGVVLALGLFFFLRGLCRLMTNRQFLRHFDPHRRVGSTRPSGESLPAASPIGENRCTLWTLLRLSVRPRRPGASAGRLFAISR